MPVYEIYKVGEDLHWKPGLDFFSQYGLSLSVIPHWNNRDGGEELDTSRCYVGKVRFEQLQEMLPKGNTVIGIDEHTGLILDFQNGCCDVMGKGSVTVIGNGAINKFSSGDELPLDLLGDWKIPEGGEGISSEVWLAANEARQEKQHQEATAIKAPENVLKLRSDRDVARDQKDWQLADSLRDEILAYGWQVMDTPNGSQLVPLDDISR
jgi:hypothetical protein